MPPAPFSSLFIDSDKQFSQEWLLQRLEAASIDYRKLAGFKPLQDITSELIGADKGMMSHIYLVILHYPDTKLKYCLKIPTFEKAIKVMDPSAEAPPNGGLTTVQLFHNNECKFYQAFKNVEGLKIPRIYSEQLIDGSTGTVPAHLLMDYCEGTEMPLDDTLTAIHLEKIAEQIALVHAHCLINNHTAETLQLVTFSFIDNVPKEHRQGMAQHIRNQLELLAPASFMEKGKALDWFQGEDEFHSWAVKKAHFECGVPPLVCNGDLWGNNLLLERGLDGGFTGNVNGLIDWQMVNFGNPTQDLARLLVLNCSAEVRRRNQERIYEVYYRKLTSFLEDHNLKPQFTLAQLIKASKSQILLQAALSALFIVFQFGDPRKAAAREKFCDRIGEVLTDCATIALEFLPNKDGRFAAL